MPDHQPVPALNGEILVDPSRVPKTAAVNDHVKSAPPGETAKTVECDVLVVGAGFSGITAIHRFRKLGLNVKCFEAGEGFGGVWFWNRYPGARVDSEWPVYQLNIPEVYTQWNFSERFPGHEELRRYMQFIDQTLDLSKDTYFNAKVVDGTWDKGCGRWKIKTQQGHTASAKYILLASGLLHRTYTPDFPGMSSYKGQIMHTGAYSESFSAKDKRIALIGAGATAVQVTQEVGKVASSLHILLRRPSTCIRMGQRPLTPDEQAQSKASLAALFASGRRSRSGFPTHAFQPRLASDMTPEQLAARLEWHWSRGGFSFLGAVDDMITDKDSNRRLYDFWRAKVCQRLTDPHKQAIMAPAVAPYYIGTKRPPLEQDYYEVLNQENVQLVDLNARPLKGFYEGGIVVGEDERIEVDAVILATGFDSFSGSVSQMGLKNQDGVELKGVWKEGIQTYLGLTVPGFPNLFMSYTPQAPTALSNGTTIIEAQVETVVDMIRKLESERARSITPTKAAADEWKATVNGPVEATLLPFTNSWWNGANIPGKKVENQTHIQGIEVYEGQCRATLDGWKGFEVVHAAA